jgi:hypothetical protein
MQRSQAAEKTAQAQAVPLPAIRPYKRSGHSNVARQLGLFTNGIANEILQVINSLGPNPITPVVVYDYTRETRYDKTTVPASTLIDPKPFTVKPYHGDPPTAVEPAEPVEPEIRTRTSAIDLLNEALASTRYMVVLQKKGKKGSVVLVKKPSM